MKDVKRTSIKIIEFQIFLLHCNYREIIVTDSVGIFNSTLFSLVYLLDPDTKKIVEYQPFQKDNIFF